MLVYWSGQMLVYEGLLELDKPANSWGEPSHGLGLALRAKTQAEQSKALDVDDTVNIM